jgi:hypothetical protein
MTVKISGTDGIDTAQLRAPDGDPVAILIDALGKVAFPAQGQSLTPNGYVKLPGGMILQWGKVSGPAGGIGITFPQPFPTACLSITVSAAIALSGTVLSTTATIDSAAGATCMRQFWNGTTLGDAGHDVYWQAIGY